MNTIEDFKNAPIGATASLNGSARVWKSRTGDTPWATAFHYQWFSSEELAEKGYVLERPAPATAREAIELAWELAHEVKPGQTIPEGTRFMEFSNSVLEEYTAGGDLKITPALAQGIRTVEPLPEPEPDWLDAPAVLATTRWCDTELWLPETGGYYWECTHCDDVRYWRDLTDVTPLYPKEV